MAGKFEKGKNVLATLREASDLASKFEDVSKIIKIAGKLSSGLALSGAALELYECLFLGGKDRDNCIRFDKLSNKIDQVIDGSKKLEEVIECDIEKLQYGDAARRIQLGMTYCREIERANEEAGKMRYQERLKETCANQYVTLAVSALLDRINGDGDFRMSILDEFYDMTKGDRSKISPLGNRLLKLVKDGMMVIGTYETVMREEEFANEISELYGSRFMRVCAKVKSVTDRCKEDFEENMKNDLDEFLDEGGSNKELFSKISDFMRDKYDWLENFCLVYNDLDGVDQHCIGESRVNSLHRNGKCGVVFYRTKGEPEMPSGRCDEAREINDEVGCANTGQNHDNIKAKLVEKDIKWIGCALITRDSDLWYGGTFSTAIDSIAGEKATSIILLK